MKEREYLTDEEIKEEIIRLTVDPDVCLARAEHRVRYKERQRLYNLRWLKKRGEQLRLEGMTIESFRKKAESLDDVLMGVEEVDS